MPQTVTIRVYHTAYSIFTLYSHKVSILVANVYVYNLDEWLLRGSLLPCYKKLKATLFSRDWRLPQLNLNFTKFSPSFKFIFVRFDHFSCKEENERQTLALYIRLVYSIFQQYIFAWLYIANSCNQNNRKLCFCSLNISGVRKCKN